MDTEQLADLRALVSAVLEGAEANQRPDLAARLSLAAQQLGRTPRPTGSAGSPGTSRSAAPASAIAGQVARTCGEALDSLRIDLLTRRTLLSDPGRTLRLKAEQRHAQARLDAFDQLAGEWPRTLGEDLAAVVSDIEFGIRTRTRASFDETAEKLEQASDPAQPIEGLRRALVTEAATCYRLLDDAIVTTTTRITAGLGIPVPEGPLHPPLASPADLAERAAVRRPSGSRSPLSGQMLGIVMPTYGGAMMAFIIPRFSGISLPLWLELLLVLTGALTMGGAALAAERQRRRARRAAELTSATGNAVEAFQLALVKQVRDGSRLAQQALRDCIGRAVNERAQTLAATAQTARSAADAAERASLMLGQIEDDLGSVRELRSRAVRLASAARQQLPAKQPGAPSAVANPQALPERAA